jgi:hypothetical protein
VLTGFAVKMSDMVVAASGTGKSPFSSPGFGDRLLSIRLGCMPMVLGFMQSMMALVQQMQGLVSDQVPMENKKAYDDAVQQADPQEDFMDLGGTGGATARAVAGANKSKFNLTNPLSLSDETLSV